MATLAREYFTRRDVNPMEPVGARSKRARPSYRAPVGMPRSRVNWRGSSASSIVLHIVLVFALLFRLANTGDVVEKPQGAGGPGPAGGGGGGNRGTGAQKERVEFIRVAPPMPKPAAAKTVEPPKPEIPKPVEPTPLPLPSLPKLSAPTLPLGSLGGAGSDGTTGSGPGSGGGVGTGVGPGRGSAVGPGTGGGGQENFPPSPIEMFIPPLPVPSSARGMRVIAEFDVDERGRVLKVTFNSTHDRGYDRRLEEVLKGYRFRPGHRPDGTPIRMLGQITIDLP